jgi:hypothetical protein
MSDQAIEILRWILLTSSVLAFLQATLLFRVFQRGLFDAGCPRTSVLAQWYRVSCVTSEFSAVGRCSWQSYPRLVVVLRNS